MDIVFKVITPGSRLSIETLTRITGTFDKIVREAVIETVLSGADDYGLVVDKTKVGRVVSKEQRKTEYGLFIDDAKKGSWEILMSLAAGGLLGKALYDLGIHFVKQHPEYDNFIKWLNDKTSRPCTKAVEQKLHRTKKIGNLEVEYKEIKVTIDEHGFRNLFCEIKLKRNSDQPYFTTSRQQLAKMKHDLGYEEDEEKAEELEERTSNTEDDEDSETS